MKKAKPPKMYTIYLGVLCREKGWPEPEPEKMLIPGRRFRCDFVWEAQRLVLEVQGGIWLPRGGHTGGQAQIDDMFKFNQLQLLGYRVIQCTPKQVCSGELAELLAQLLPKVAA